MPNGISYTTRLDHAMSECSNCGRGTDLYYHGLPVCVDCSDVLPDHMLPERKTENRSVETAGEMPSSNEPLD